MTDSPKTRAAFLRQELQRHERLYYQEAKPEITDREFDRLMAELAAIEEEHPEFRTADSPTQRVGGEPTEGFEQVEHQPPMLSLDNTYDHGELEEWVGRLKRLVPDTEIDFVCELKVDGVSLSLLYEDGVLTEAATRGNGRIGDLVTVNARTIRTLPLRLPAGAPARLLVRAETYMRRSVFAALNEERAAAGQELYANPRNTTAGTVRLLDSRDVARRRLDVACYEWVQPAGGAGSGGSGGDDGGDGGDGGGGGDGSGGDGDDGSDGEKKRRSHGDCLAALADLGLPVDDSWRRCASLEEVVAFCDEWQEKRGDLDFETDGVVVKVDDPELRERLGATAKAPRWAVAFKFEAEQAETVVLAINAQVGRTGAVTPVAELEPVLVAGTTVKRATLHNYEDLGDKDIRVDDTVLIEKGGDIIPKVVSVFKDRRGPKSQRFEPPDECPVCGEKLYQAEEEALLRCVNAACPAVVRERIRHFASRNAMDIEGLGDWMVGELVGGGLVKNVADLYSLTEAQLADLTKAPSEELVKTRADSFQVLRTFAELAKVPGEELEKALAQATHGLQKLAEPAKLPGEELEKALARATHGLQKLAEPAKLPGEELEKALARATHGLRKLAEPAKVPREKLEKALRQGIRALQAGPDLGTAIASLRLPGIGPKRAKLLAQKFDSLEKLAATSNKELANTALATRLGERSAAKTVDSGEHSKRQPFARLIYGLGIRHVGENTASLLARQFPSIEDLTEASLEELEAVPEIGTIIARSVREFFDSDPNQELIKRLQAAGLRLHQEPADKAEGGRLEGKVFVLTGTLSGMSRKAASARITALGGKVTGSVSRNTDFLVYGDKAGSKRRKADEIGIKSLNEAEFEQLLAARSGDSTA